MTARMEEGIDIFSAQLLAFSSNHPNLETKIEQKPVTGQGGILSYLRTGRDVAPSILPDLVALPTEQMATAFAENLVFPLDDAIDPALFNDLYPAAAAFTQADSQTIGYPFAVTELSHVAYNRNSITSTLPLTWSQVSREVDGQFIFPAAGEHGAMMALQLYMALGGTLTNEAGQPSLQTEPLAQALTLLSEGRNSDFIAIQSSNVSTLEQSWQVFQEGSAALVQTTADQYLQLRSPDLPPGFAPLPGPERPLTPLVDGWVWAVSTPDPDQKALAVELLSLLVGEPHYGEWSYQSGILPARRQAFEQWPPDDPYTTFIQQELERARPNPVSENNVILTALGDAVFEVVSLSLSPQAAAEAAATAVQP